VPPVATEPSKGGPGIKRTTKCGARMLTIEVRNDKSGIKVKAEINPSSSQSWAATLTHERVIAWRGQVSKGRLERVVPNYRGSDTIGVRLTDQQGTVCAGEVILPA
jgi:hypothetical protein